MPRAGLAPASVTEAAADLADEIGIDRMSMGLVAERLGVKTPSLYKHVDNLADLVHRVGVLAMNELGDTIRDATQGRAGRDALVAGTRAMRDYVVAHPGRYAAGNAAKITGPDDPLMAAANRVMDSWAAMLHGYRIDPTQQTHALRLLRSLLHGFTTLESVGSFQLGTDLDDSFDWMIDFVDQSLTRAAKPTPSERD
ncbi:TetR/AcrR family transcriptional regulator [Rhodococcoides fascians]|uniref:TetR/AcrR family transcriptional regulator n=1 Tax=Rhodococcoides fascians TaxID=1828 RepID=UPI00050C0C02|nr:TetR/AcrR family transcriptional regulator [Rhodococcus fascians]